MDCTCNIFDCHKDGNTQPTIEGVGVCSVCVSHGNSDEAGETTAK